MTVSIAVTEPSSSVWRRLGPGVAIVAGLLAVVVASAYMLGQGPQPVGLGDVIDHFQGQASPHVQGVVEGSRLPRWQAGLLAGACLGAAGAVFQATTRNPLAEPGLLGVGAGAQVAMALVAIGSVELTGYPRSFAALAGGFVAALITFVVASGAGLSAARLLLAGVAVSLAGAAIASTLFILYEEQTAGLFFWGQGTLAQLGFANLEAAWPFALVGAVLGLVLAPRLDLLSLGDERAASLGARVLPTRIGGLAAGVILTCAAVSVTGPIAFVGLAAPHIARGAGARKHLWLIPASALWGAALVLAADGIARGLVSEVVTGELPVGVITALLGAPFLIVLARRVAGGTPPQDTARLTTLHLPTWLALLGAALLLVVVGVVTLSMGDAAVTVPEVVQALGGGGEQAIRTIVVDGRLPQTVVAAVAGAALAVSGCLFQSATRNPLASPATLGIVGGASIAALTVAIVLPSAPVELVPFAAFLGGLVALAVLLALAGRFDPTRLLLVGVGLFALTSAVVDLIVVRNQLQTAQALSWLAGTTYGRGYEDLILVLPSLVVVLPLSLLAARHADVLSFGDDAASGLGVPADRARLLMLLGATLLAGAGVATVGAVAFLGLVAPQIARVLGGPRHLRWIPLSAITGAVLLVMADAVGRSVIAPRSVPAGLVVALVGAPAFVALLWWTRTGGDTADGGGGT